MSSSTAPIRRADAPETLTVDGLVAAPRQVERSPGPLAPLLEAAAPHGDHGTVYSGDGLFTASIPLDVLRRAELSDEGRLRIVDTPTKCWLVKDVRRIEVTEGRCADSLPEAERART